jgi:hypothetical protein
MAQYKMTVREAAAADIAKLLIELQRLDPNQTPTSAMEALELVEALLMVAGVPEDYSKDPVREILNGILWRFRNPDAVPDVG